MWELFTAKEFLAALIGGVLSAIGSVAAIFAQQKAARRTGDKIAREFVGDLIGNIFELSDKYEEMRIRNNYIEREFLVLLANEIGSYAKVREQIVAIRERAVRKKIHNFFATVDGYLIRINFGLNEFYRLQNEANSTTENSDKKNALIADSDQHISRAHRQSEALRMFIVSERDALGSVV